MQIACTAFFVFAIFWTLVALQSTGRHYNQIGLSTTEAKRYKRWTRLEPSVRFVDRNKKWTRLEPSVRFFDKRWTRLEPSVRFFD